MTLIDKYLIAINRIGFVCFLFNTWLYSHTVDKQIDTVLTILSIMGGSLGIVIGILLFGRKAKKDNMMSRVFVFSVLVIQIVLFLIYKGALRSEITVAFWSFFSKYPALLWYLVIINIITLIAFGVDKIASMENRSRIRIVTLLGLAFIGGSIGALIGMYAFRHKTRKDYFTVGVPIIMLMQVVMLFFLMNVK